LTTSQNSSDRVWPKTGLWAASYRIMFPLAGLWAALCVALWQWGTIPAATLEWHVHEMTFGFAGAVLGGYLWTACPSWTGRAPVNGWPVAILAGLWCAARLCHFAAFEGAAFVTGAYFLWLASVLAFEAYRGQKAWRVGFILFVLGAGLGSFSWSAAMLGEGVPSFAIALPVVAFSALLIVVGGQIVPAFLARGRDVAATDRTRDPKYLSGIAVGLMGLAIAGIWTDRAGPAGALLALAAGLIALRMSRWHLRAAWGDPLLAMLVIGYIWLPIGLVLWALALLGAEVPAAQAVHALLMGAMGGLILAVSVRAVAQRTPQGLRARRGTGLAFALVFCATVARLLGQVDIAAAFWCVGWVIYVMLFAGGVSGPVPRPVFSGARHIQG